MSEFLIAGDPLLKSLDYFLFHKENIQWLAIYRIFFATIGLIYWGLVHLELENLYGAKGLVPDSYEDRRWFCLLPMSFKTKSYQPKGLSPRMVELILLVALYCLAIGFLSQISAFIAFSCYSYFNRRNPFVEAGPEQFMRVMSFLFIFAPADKGLSLYHFLSTGSFGLDEMVPAWSLQLMRFQILIIVFQTFVSKIIDKSWRSGEAVYWTMKTVHYSNFLNFPKTLNRPIVFKSMTWGTLAIQALAPFLIWFKPTHELAIILLFLLHFGLLLTVRVGLYQPLMIGSLMLFF